MRLTQAQKQKAYRERCKVAKVTPGTSAILVVGLKGNETVTNSNGNAPVTVESNVTKCECAAENPAIVALDEQGYTFDDLPFDIQQQIDKYAGGPLCPNRGEMIRCAIEAYCEATT